MFPTIHIGPLVLQSPGLFLLLGVWVGLSLAGKRAHWHNMESNALDNLIMAMLIGFILGGRLIFIAANISTFSNSPLDIFSPNFDLFQLNGGLASGLISGWVYAQRSGFSIWPSLDALTPFFAALATAIGFAHLASGAAYGEVTSAAWAIELRGGMRHPSQVYEIVGALLILLMIGTRKPYQTSGVLFLVFVSASAGMSLFLQAFRGDASLTQGGIRIAQITAWAVLAVALALLDNRLHTPIPEPNLPTPSQDQ